MLYERGNIINDEKVKEFFASRKLSEGTEKNYVSVLTNYSNAIEKLPSEWIREANCEMDHGVRREERQINVYFNIFHTYLKRKGRSVITMNRSFTDIKTFYHYFKIDTPNNPVKRIGEQPGSDVITKDELKRAVRNSNIRDRAVIYLCSSSGMGISEIIKLKYYDFLAALDLPANLGENEIREKLGKNPIPVWKIESKTGQEYTTFSTPESVYNILDYLEQRKIHSDWLFTGQNKDEQMFEGTLVNAFARLNDKLGFGSRKGGRGRRFTTHALRVYFREALQKAGVDAVKIKFLLGLKISPAEQNFTIEDLKKDYIKSLSELSLEPIEIKTINEATLEELQERIKELESKMSEKR